MTKPAFNIRDRVYHVTPDSPEGIVIDVQYNYASGIYLYQVSFSPTQASLWYFEIELSYNKSF